MSSYGLNIVILGFSVSGSAAAVHTGDADFSPTWNNLFFHPICSESDKH